MNPTHTATVKRAGFTLIELSIVLVIIGLLIGGVLVGRDLIKAAKVRAQISQIEKYNTAANTFKLKYGGLPGDLKNIEANAFGLYAMNPLPDPTFLGVGDGNGFINTNGCGSSATFCLHTDLQDEPYMFWRHLSDAKLIDGNYGANLNASVGGSPVTSSIDVINTFYPFPNLGRAMLKLIIPEMERIIF